VALNIKGAISGNQTILLLMQTVGYNKDMVDVAKSLTGSSICYVTTNKTYDSLQETFKKNKISGLVYNIRMKKFKEKIQKIKQELPTLESQLKKLKTIKKKPN
jgi:hypothetical protein